MIYGTIMLSITAAATAANVWQAYGEIDTVIQHLIIEWGQFIRFIFDKMEGHIYESELFVTSRGIT